MSVVGFEAYDRRNKRTYRVVSIKWNYGDILRKFHKGVPSGDWIPEEVVVILGNGKHRAFNYNPSPTSYLDGPLRFVYRYGDRNLRDLTLKEIAA